MARRCGCRNGRWESEKESRRLWRSDTRSEHAIGSFLKACLRCNTLGCCRAPDLRRPGEANGPQPLVRVLFWARLAANWPVHRHLETRHGFRCSWVHALARFFQQPKLPCISTLLPVAFHLNLCSAAGTAKTLKGRHYLPTASDDLPSISCRVRTNWRHSTKEPSRAESASGVGQKHTRHTWKTKTLGQNRGLPSRPHRRPHCDSIWQHPPTPGAGFPIWLKNGMQCFK